MRNCVAAFVKLNASATARKYRRCRSSIANHYAKKAWLRKHPGIGRIQLRGGRWDQLINKITAT
jgi:hypothetical protein